MKIISGQFIPRDLPKRRDVIFLGARSSKARENYNTTAADFVLQNWIRKYLRRAVFVTDMIKTKGRPGKRFREWNKDATFKNMLLKELKTINPTIIVVMNRKAEEILKNDPLFLKYKSKVRSIYPPYYVARWNKFNDWDHQFKSILKALNK